MKFFSIAIPTYEMSGKGAEFLEHSFIKIKTQTFKDFEIVISDHSKDNSIQSLCEKWSSIFDITYIRNETGRGNLSPNINNAISHSKGQWIKILFQDDFLYDENSLNIIYNNINNSDSKWVIFKTQHSNDGFTFYREFTPRWNDRILYGNNTLSSPTALTIKNDKDKLLFDDNYNWLMDCDYYQRCFNKFGLPLIINIVTTAIRTCDTQTSNTMSNEDKRKEHVNLLKKHKII